MNNFTKDELQELLALFDCETPLKNKIQAMIDNYPKPDEPVYHRFIVKPEALPWIAKKLKDTGKV